MGVNLEVISLKLLILVYYKMSNKIKKTIKTILNLLIVMITNLQLVYQLWVMFKIKGIKVSHL